MGMKEVVHGHEGGGSRGVKGGRPKGQKGGRKEPVASSKQSAIRRRGRLSGTPPGSAFSPR